jgi:5-formyltetrahydrofolate cyclo-ligase
LCPKTKKESRSDSRKELRQEFRQRRRNIVGPSRKACEEQLLYHLDQFCSTLKPNRVGAYLSNDGEPDIRPWLEGLARPIGLPRVCGESMQFHSWQSGDTLQPNKWHIEEPSTTASTLELSAGDLLLVPLVAYDAQGNRLGMGGGYYDRYLATLASQPLLLGTGFQAQFSEQDLPREAWDIPLHAMVTDAGMVEFPPQS